MHDPSPFASSPPRRVAADIDLTHMAGITRPLHLAPARHRRTVRLLAYLPGALAILGICAITALLLAITVP